MQALTQASGAHDALSNVTSITASSESALAADVPLAAVQKRIKEVLYELEARVRLDNMRLRDALAQTQVLSSSRPLVLLLPPVSVFV